MSDEMDLVFRNAANIVEHRTRQARNMQSAELKRQVSRIAKWVLSLGSGSPRDHPPGIASFQTSRKAVVPRSE